MKIGNEHPVGLSTVLGLLPFVIAGIVFIVLLAMNGGDVAKAQQLTLAIIMAVALVGTAAMRQWRAVNGGGTSAPPADPTPPATSDAMPAPDEEIDLTRAA